MGRLVLTVDVVDGLPAVTGFERPNLEAEAAHFNAVDSEVRRLMARAPASEPRSYSHWGMFHG